jgi:penicillin-binding protein 2
VDSCDTYFYTIAAKMGIDNLAFYGDLVGFGHPTGVDLPHETPGVMPSPQWKLRNYRQKWYAGETPSVGIGQGAVTVTPLQLARGLAGLAMGGTWHRPRLVASEPDKVVEWKLNPDNVQKVKDGMYGVVNEGGGTGVRAKLPNISVCGKTGTAQLTSEDYAKSQGRKTSEDNAWFEAFAPCENPEIVVVALFERFPGHGQYAAPITRDIMKAYFDKKVRLTMLEQQKQAAEKQVASLGNLGLPTAGSGIRVQGSGTQAPTASEAPVRSVSVPVGSAARPEPRSQTPEPRPQN